MRKSLLGGIAFIFLSACAPVSPNVSNLEVEPPDIFFQSLHDRSAAFDSHANELQEKADDLKKPLVGTGIAYGKLVPIVAEVYSLLAQDAGIQKGDELLAIDGTPIYSGMEAARTTTGNDLSKIGTPVRLTMRVQRHLPFTFASKETDFHVRKVLLRTSSAKEIAEFENDLRKFRSRLSEYDALIENRDALFRADAKKYVKNMAAFTQELQDFERYLARRIESVEENGYHRARYTKVSSNPPFLLLEP